MLISSAAYDDSALAELLEDIVSVHGVEGLAGTGHDGDDLDDLLADLFGDQPTEGLSDPDDVPEPPADPITHPGDLWKLGDHYVLCGDATSTTDLGRLLGPSQADMVWTDPPYGVAIASRIGTKGVSSSQARSLGHQGIANDDFDVEELTAFLQEALSVAYEVCKEGGAWYVAAPHGPIGLAFSRVLHELGVWRHSLVWVKDSLVLGRADYHYRHEPLYYGWKPGASHFFVDDRSQSTVWEIPRPRRSADHPTMKPVELVERAVNNSSRPGALVLDPFGGSGSTLIACERAGRHARLVEIDPHFVDVTCRRWQEYTGEKPVLVTRLGDEGEQWGRMWRHRGRTSIGEIPSAACPRRTR